MKRKLQAEKQAQPAGIRVVILLSRMNRPAWLPTSALPPGERSQISSPLKFWIACRSRGIRSSSIWPSASSTWRPFTVCSVKVMRGFVDQFGFCGQVGLSGSIRTRCACAAVPASIPARAATEAKARNGLRISDPHVTVVRRAPAHPLWRGGLLSVDNDDVGHGHAVVPGGGVHRGHGRRPGHARPALALPRGAVADIAAADGGFRGGRGLFLLVAIEHVH